MPALTNDDGTPFFANLNAPSRIRITINEAFILSGALRDTVKFYQTILDDDTKDIGDLRKRLRKMSSDLIMRAHEIERAIDDDKWQQWDER